MPIRGLQALLKPPFPVRKYNISLPRIKRGFCANFKLKFIFGKSAAEWLATNLYWQLNNGC